MNKVIKFILTVHIYLLLSSTGYAGDVDFIKIAAELESAVVPIVITGVVELPPPYSQNAETELGSGTGFIVSNDGYIITCQHVVGEKLYVEVPVPHSNNPVKAKLVSSKITVLLKQNNLAHEFDATVIQASKIADVAVIKIDAHNLKAIELGDSSKLRKLQKILVMGYPLGSRLGLKDITVNTGDITSIREGGNIIQIEAGVSPGNSGGPLIDEYGRAVGIVFAKVMDKTADNINFVISINIAKDLMRNAGIDIGNVEGGNKRNNYKIENKEEYKVEDETEYEVDYEDESDKVVEDTTKDEVKDTKDEEEGIATIYIVLLVLLTLIILGSAIVALLIFSERSRKTFAPLSEQPTINPAEYGYTLLFVHRGNDAGKTCQIHHIETTIGRQHNCNLVLNDGQVSGIHGAIIATDTGFYLYNRSNTNKTYVNNNPINSIRLQNGDTIKMGNTIIEFKHNL